MAISFPPFTLFAAAFSVTFMLSSVLAFRESQASPRRRACWTALALACALHSLVLCLQAVSQSERSVTTLTTALLQQAMIWVVWSALNESLPQWDRQYLRITLGIQAAATTSVAVFRALGLIGDHVMYGFQAAAVMLPFLWNLFQPTTGGITEATPALADEDTTVASLEVSVALRQYYVVVVGSMFLVQLLLLDRNPNTAFSVVAHDGVAAFLVEYVRRRFQGLTVEARGEATDDVVV